MRCDLCVGARVVWTRGDRPEICAACGGTGSYLFVSLRDPSAWLRGARILPPHASSTDGHLAAAIETVAYLHRRQTSGWPCWDGCSPTLGHAGGCPNGHPGPSAEEIAARWSPYA